MSTSPTITDTSSITPAPHPGEVLKIEFLDPLSITQYRLAKDLSVPESQVSKLVRGKIGLSANFAVRLSAYFGNSAEFWLGIQESYDLFHARQHIDLTTIPTWDKKTA